MQAFVTGAAGFIGSNLVDRLLEQGHAVVGYDNLSTGYRQFLVGALSHPNFKYIEGDVLDAARLNHSVRGAEIVFHMAANADVRFGVEHPRKDLEQTPSPLLMFWRLCAPTASRPSPLLRHDPRCTSSCNCNRRKPRTW